MRSLYKVIKSTSVEIEEEVCISASSKDDSFDEDTFDINENESPRENSLENTIKYKLQLEKQAKQLLNDAAIQSEVMLSDAKEESENLINNTKIESEKQLKEQAQKGYTDGLNKGYSEIIEKHNILIEQAQKIVNEAENYKKTSVESLENEIIQLVIASVEKITRKLLDENDDIILGVIKNAIESMTFRDYLIITVSKDDFKAVEFAKNKILATYPGISKIEIKVADGFKKGDLEIESDSGSLNPSVTFQIKTMIGEFNKLILSSDNL